MDQNLNEERNESEASSMWQKLTAAWRSEDKPAAMKRWVYESRKQLLLSVGGAAVLTAAIWGGTAYVKANTIPYLQVYNGEQFIGEIASADQLDALYDAKLKEIQADNPNAIMKIDTSAIHTVEEQAFKAEPATVETLKKVAEVIPSYAEGVELKVEGKTVGIVKDQATADKVIAQIKNQYNPDLNEKPAVKTLSATKSAQTTKAVSHVESVSLRERVATVETETTPDKVLTPEEAVMLLTSGHTEKEKYTVQKGDTVSSIVEKMHVSRETIYRNNPGVGEEYLQVGQVLDITEPDPLVTVKTVERYTEYVVTEPQVEIRENPDMPAGESKVVREGKQGMKRMTYRLIKDNGLLTKEEWIEQEVIDAPVSKIVMKGTKVVNGEGSGSFIYPVNNASLSSGYGSRWGTTHKGLDMTSSDKTISAADEGVIEYAGWKNGYGNCIIIDHNNGYKTLYGHLSKITVEEGQIVEQGEQIGIMGSTGNSTGTHLHFEIHKNGEVVNPSKYL
ncbi:peptidoglycan DD-metalloendopeptidase family protein [Paenibacillus marinisediminis]